MVAQVAEKLSELTPVGIGPLDVLPSMTYGEDILGKKTRLRDLYVTATHTHTHTDGVAHCAI